MSWRHKLGFVRHGSDRRSLSEWLAAVGRQEDEERQAELLRQVNAIANGEHEAP
jgi:hypothetical protein